MPLINGPLVRNTRTRQRRKTSEVAEKVGIAEGTLRNAEAGRQPVSMIVVYALAEELALPADAILAIVPSQRGVA